MCIIIDANSAHQITQKKPDGLPVLRWLLNPKIKSGIIVGGKLSEELAGSGLLETLRVLKQAGKLHTVNRDLIEEKKDQITCRSNDSHVVALALVSNCPLVYTKDKKLHSDLKSNCNSGSKINIYQNKSHAHLLQECRCA